MKKLLVILFLVTIPVLAVSQKHRAIGDEFVKEYSKESLAYLDTITDNNYENYKVAGYRLQPPSYYDWEYFQIDIGIVCDQYENIRMANPWEVDDGYLQSTWHVDNNFELLCMYSLEEGFILIMSSGPRY